jgi:hypothetical protein
MQRSNQIGAIDLQKNQSNISQHRTKTSHQTINQKQPRYCRNGSYRHRVYHQFERSRARAAPKQRCMIALCCERRAGRPSLRRIIGGEDSRTKYESCLTTQQQRPKNNNNNQQPTTIRFGTFWRASAGRVAVRRCCTGTASLAALRRCARGAAVQRVIFRRLNGDVMMFDRSLSC